eukprot:gene20197-22171_t
MAFFNLTKLGVQAPIKQSLKNDEFANNDGLKPTSSSQQERMSMGLAPSPTRNSQISSQNYHDSSMRSASEAQRSHVLYTQRLTKHERPKLAPNEVYRKQVTSSQNHGWWIQDGAPKTLPWTNVERHSRVNSEMTRFVDEMTLTNKHFSLF